MIEIGERKRESKGKRIREIYIYCLQERSRKMERRDTQKQRRDAG